MSGRSARSSMRSCEGTACGMSRSLNYAMQPIGVPNLYNCWRDLKKNLENFLPNSRQVAGAETLLDF